jgi:hypothetical protein
MLDQLPDYALYVIAECIASETSFRDKVDVAIDAAVLAVTCKSLEQLTRDINQLIDPMSTDGKLTPDVIDNLKRKKNRRIPAHIAKSSWGLSDDDLASLSFKIVRQKRMYLLQDIKKVSEVKFDGDCMKLYNSKRIHKLLDALSQPIRPDSNYCMNYIKTGKGNPDDIARLLKEMEFYHTYTAYPQLYWVYAQKYELEYGYYDRDHISSDAKSVALKRFKKKHPDKLHIVPETLLKYL